jgi:uncharacterized protein
MNAHPLYHRFTTADHYYVYDTYSNQILDTPQPVWEGLDQALADSGHFPSPDAATPELEKAQEAGYLLPCEVTDMRFYPRKDMMLARISTRLPQLTLELTEQCNFRCRYCEYSHQSDRVYRPQEMTRGTALNAIRFYLAHSTEANERCISFWGGEALIKFRLIKEVIEYVGSLAPERPPMFQFTTNGALITPEIARRSNT